MSTEKKDGISKLGKAREIIHIHPFPNISQLQQETIKELRVPTMKPPKANSNTTLLLLTFLTGPRFTGQAVPETTMEAVAALKRKEVSMMMNGFPRS